MRDTVKLIAFLIFLLLLPASMVVGVVAGSLTGALVLMGLGFVGSVVSAALYLGHWDKE